MIKGTPLENTLSFLYALQQVDTQLDEIRELKGDLPDIVARLENRVAEMKAELKNIQDQIKQLRSERDSADIEAVALAEKIEKYKGQQLQVKSNRQYDALSKEIDGAESKILIMEKEVESAEGKMQTLKVDADALTAKIEESTAELGERREELRVVDKEHEKEELKFRHERDKLIVRISASHLEKYERIRKAKGGRAVVAVKGKACGGCFSLVPPQKILELRQNAHLFTCESCGRILVSDDITTKVPVH